MDAITEFIDDLKRRGLVTARQAGVLRDLETGRLFPVRLELNAVLYAGIALIVYGTGLVVAKHFQDLGHVAILGTLSAAVLGCGWYVGSRAPDFDPEPVPSPTFAFDYVLQLGTLLFGTEVTYVETQFHLLGPAWTWYLLGAGLAQLGLAYRFDNRLTLGLALGTLATWAGVRGGWWAVGVPARSIAFGIGAVAVGAAVEWAQIKRHFSATYALFGGHAICLGLAWEMGAADPVGCLGWGVVLLTVCAGMGWLAWQRRWFSFAVYAALYTYVGFVIAIVSLFRAAMEPVTMSFLLAAGAVGMVIGVLRVRKAFE